MKVTAVAYTAYPGDNIPKLLTFYKDALGLRVDRAHPDEANAQFVEFAIGSDQWFTLMPESFAGRPAGSGSGVVFEVVDIDAALAQVGKLAKVPTKNQPTFRTAAPPRLKIPKATKSACTSSKREDQPARAGVGVPSCFNGFQRTRLDVDLTFAGPTACKTSLMMSTSATGETLPMPLPSS